jgi:CRISPR system Cascade subunit CasB
VTTQMITSGRAAPARPAPRWAEVLHTTLARIRNDPAALAACRRGVGKRPLDVPAMWPFLAAALDTVPESRAGRRAVEAACHHALALCATHQQSRPEPMHVRGLSGGLGRACRHLSAALERKGRSAEGVTRRFLATATADSVEELTGHLRGLIPQLRENAIPLDYVRLAQDVAAWQYPVSRARVRRRWGLDFYRREVPGNDQHEENADGLA